MVTRWIETRSRLATTEIGKSISVDYWISVIGMYTYIFMNHENKTFLH